METTLLSIGIDIGTSTTSMVFSRLYIENAAGMFTVPRMTIAGKEVIYKSRIYNTPLLDEYRLDVQKIQQILTEEYRQANINPKDVETGAVIITGESAVKENAQSVLQSISQFAGDFVVAAAGPDLESVLSGQGSGAQRFSRENHCRVINIDIGGGTSNFALFESGQVKEHSCYDIGGRLIKVGAERRITWISPRLRPVLDHLKLSLQIGDTLTEGQARRITETMAQVLGDVFQMNAGTPLASALLTRKSSPMEGTRPQYLALSGGVAELIEHPPKDFFQYGDLGAFLAEAVTQSGWYRNCSVAASKERIRATVVGAGSYTTALSGSTISCQPDSVLPLKNLPVLLFSPEEEANACQGEGEDLRKKLEWFLGQTDSDNAVLSFVHTKHPGYAEIRRLAYSIAQAAQSIIRAQQPLVIVCEDDFAKSLGQCLRRTAPGAAFVSIDSVVTRQGDYLDIGRPILNGLAVPVVVKTLIVGES